jgi:hypothetical protein
MMAAAASTARIPIDRLTFDMTFMRGIIEISEAGYSRWADQVVS